MPNTEMLRQRGLTNPIPELDEAREAVRAVVEDGQRAAEVFGSIRSLVQRAEPRMGTLDINDVIEKVLMLAHGELQNQDVLVRADLKATLPRLRGDRVQLQQVLLNLVTNANQAMAGVRDRPRVLTIRSRLHERDDILVEVEDSGIGLDPTSIDQIFESMFTTKPDGMGMGLSISRSIVAAHGGRLWASPRDASAQSFASFCAPIYRATGSSTELRSDPQVSLLKNPKRMEKPRDLLGTAMPLRVIAA
jgi:C4-dicarboxylate-specific signal transduction histidine kinase